MRACSRKSRSSSSGRGQGAHGSDRVAIIFADNAVPTRNWLQVRVKATPHTALEQDEVFYFGNAVGDADGDGVAAYADMYAVSQQSGQPAAVESPLDINRDGSITRADVDAVFPEIGRSPVLNLITVPSVVATDDAAAIDEDTAAVIDVLSNDRDTDGNPLNVANAAAASALGASVTINPDGTLTYDPSGSATLQALATGQIMEDTFTYTLADVRGGTDTRTVAVTVSGLDEPLGGELLAREPSGDGPVPLAIDLATSRGDMEGTGGVSAHDAVMKEAARQETLEIRLRTWDWLWWYDYEQMRTKKRSSKGDRLIEQAADELLAAWPA